MDPVNTRAAPRPPGIRRDALLPTTTLASLEEWLATARPGAAMEYHRGFLALDRGKGSPLGEERGLELDRVAAALMTMAEAGQIHLVQRRHGGADYTYVAVAAQPGSRRSAS